VAAVESGHFDAEITPVTVPAHKETDKEGNEIDLPETVVTKGRRSAAGDHARGPRGAQAGVQGGRLGHGRKRVSVERRRRALLVMSDEKAAELGLKPRARIIASSVAGLRPEIMGLGPIPAIGKTC